MKKRFSGHIDRLWDEIYITQGDINEIALQVDRLDQIEEQETKKATATIDSLRKILQKQIDKIALTIGEFKSLARQKLHLNNADVLQISQFDAEFRNYVDSTMLMLTSLRERLDGAYQKSLDSTRFPTWRTNPYADLPTDEIDPVSRTKYHFQFGNSGFPFSTIPGESSYRRIKSTNVVTSSDFLLWEDVSLGVSLGVEEEIVAMDESANFLTMNRLYVQGFGFLSGIDIGEMTGQEKLRTSGVTDSVVMIVRSNEVRIIDPNPAHARDRVLIVDNVFEGVERKIIDAGFVCSTRKATAGAQESNSRRLVIFTDTALFVSGDYDLLGSTFLNAREINFGLFTRIDVPEIKRISYMTVHNGTINQAVLDVTHETSTTRFYLVDLTKTYYPTVTYTAGLRWNDYTGTQPYPYHISATSSVITRYRKDIVLGTENVNDVSYRDKIFVLRESTEKLMLVKFEDGILFPYDYQDPRRSFPIKLISRENYPVTGFAEVNGTNSIVTIKIYWNHTLIAQTNFDDSSIIPQYASSASNFLKSFWDCYALLVDQDPNSATRLPRIDLLRRTAAYTSYHTVTISFDADGIVTNASISNAGNHPTGSIGYSASAVFQRIRSEWVQYETAGRYLRFYDSTGNTLRTFYYAQSPLIGYLSMPYEKSSILVLDRRSIVLIIRNRTAIRIDQDTTFRVSYSTIFKSTRDIMATGFVNGHVYFLGYESGSFVLVIPHLKIELTSTSPLYVTADGIYERSLSGTKSVSSKKLFTFERNDFLAKVSEVKTLKIAFADPYISEKQDSLITGLKRQTIVAFGKKSGIAMVRQVVGRNALSQTQVYPVNFQESSEVLAMDSFRGGIIRRETIEVNEKNDSELFITTATKDDLVVLLKNIPGTLVPVVNRIQLPAQTKTIQNYLDTGTVSSIYDEGSGVASILSGSFLDPAKVITQMTRDTARERANKVVTKSSLMSSYVSTIADVLFETILFDGAHTKIGKYSLDRQTLLGRFVGDPGMRPRRLVVDRTTIRTVNFNRIQILIPAKGSAAVDTQFSIDGKRTLGSRIFTYTPKIIQMERRPMRWKMFTPTTTVLGSTTVIDNDLFDFISSKLPFYLSYGLVEYDQLTDTIYVPTDIFFQSNGGNTVVGKDFGFRAILASVLDIQPRSVYNLTPYDAAPNT